MRKSRILALFSNFDEAFAAVSDIRHYKVPGVSVDDVTVISPIEHPEIEEVLGERTSHVPKFTLIGALCGSTFGFIFLATVEDRRDRGTGERLVFAPDASDQAKARYVAGYSLTWLRERAVRVSFLGCGQRVPDDLRIATPRHIAMAMLGEPLDAAGPRREGAEGQCA